ncbi:MAG: UDP-N-acetylmuramoyl-L-alanine--D-glutamate ligase [Anaerolineales bacterium]|nr:UDP-N-acetylmuramoyl-L-alanine--D-glutamate ligase [Anaerolineales bacterium]
MKDWKDERVIILGAARQGLALARYLAAHGATVVLSDMREPEVLAEARQSLSDVDVEWALGGHPLELLDQAKLVCLSGGVPLQIEFIEKTLFRGIPLSNDSQIFLDAAPCKVIGITGSAGKSTTTTLVGRMAAAAAEMDKRLRKTYMGGNIGDPLLNYVDEMQPNDLAVMELSSFQLELMTTAPQIAAVLNITPNHLDRHGTMQAYTAAKANILLYQQEDDIAVLNREDRGSWDLVDKIAGWLYTFGMGALAPRQLGTFVRDEAIWLRNADGEVEVMPLSQIQLRGEHNRMAVLAACAIAAAAGLSVEAMRKGVEDFRGVIHRLEFVREWGGAAWYNDSIATAPERSMAAIRAFEEPVVLLAGGRDKDLPWEDFAELVRQRVDHLVVFGDAADLILSKIGEVQPGQRPYSLDRCENLAHAVETAKGLVEQGDVVLLSPGGTSYDEFADFEERGERFKKLVRQL